MTKKIVCAALLAAASLAHAHQAAVPSGAGGNEACQPSRFGPNDEAGAANNITPAKTMEAARLIKRGKAIRMGIETNSKTPAYPPRTFSVTVLSPGQEQGGTLVDNKASYNDDIIMGWVGIVLLLVGLSHLGIDNTIYNLNKAMYIYIACGHKKMGIEKV